MSRQPTTDEAILKDSVKNPWRFGVLVERYQAPFLRKACTMLHAETAAEDAVQDTFVKIYKNASRFERQHGAKFSSWAYKILTNTCLTYAEKARKERLEAYEAGTIELDLLGGGDGQGIVDRASSVGATLGRLPQRLSRLLTLYFFENKSYQEIALSEKLSLSAVKSGLHRARKQFKEIFITLS